MTPGRYLEDTHSLGMAEKIVKKSRCLVFFGNTPSLFTFGRGQSLLDKHGLQIPSIRHIDGCLVWSYKLHNNAACTEYIHGLQVLVIF